MFEIKQKRKIKEILKWRRKRYRWNGIKYEVKIKKKN